MCGAIGIVFQALNRCGNGIFCALEIDHAIMLLVTTTNMTGGNPALVVTATSFDFFLQQGA